MLYRHRWQAELHLRSIKVVLQMDRLRCKTPQRVRNEFYMHLVGYNLIRGVMAAAAYQCGKSPWEISFKGTMQTLSQFLPVLMASDAMEAWCKALSTAHVAQHRGLKFSGTLGCLRLAKDLRLIDAIAPLLEDLRTKARFRLATRLVDQVLCDAGEHPSS